MIRMKNIKKRYEKDCIALNGVNLHIRKGEFVFITGPSGAGKTTLLKLIYCEEQADRGEILVNGLNLNRLRAGSIPYLRRNIGVVFQDFKLIRSKSVFENIAFALRVIGTPKSAMKRKGWDVLRRVGLQHKINSFPLRLSGGEQQRVAIARAVVNDPVILLADEPTGNLDSVVAEEIMELLLEINARGTTVLIASHNMELVKRMKKRVVRLERGKCVDDSEPGKSDVSESEETASSLETP